jgi:hypothetical protein
MIKVEWNFVTEKRSSLFCQSIIADTKIHKIYQRDKIKVDICFEWNVSW